MSDPNIFSINSMLFLQPYKGKIENTKNIKYYFDLTNRKAYCPFPP